MAITAINITPSNQGKGSIVLEWFKTFAKEKGFERLVLQEVITEEGYHFALKNGFSKNLIHSRKYLESPIVLTEIMNYIYKD